MQYAIETERRSIQWPITKNMGLFLKLRGKLRLDSNYPRCGKRRQVRTLLAVPQAISPTKRRTAERLRLEMRQAAKDLNFEAAADLRHVIMELRVPIIFLPRQEVTSP